MKRPSELIRADEYYVGAEEPRLKLGIAEDGSLLFVLRPLKSEHIIGLERDNALQILRQLIEVIESRPTGTPE